MDKFDCPSIYCCKWGQYEFCNCKKASKSGSAATVQDCLAYRKMMEDQKKQDDEKI